MTIRIVLADGHQQYRQNLRVMLEAAPDLQAVGEAAEGPEALALGRELGPDVLIIDVAMPVLSGIDVTRLLAADHPEVKVLALSLHADKQFVAAMLAAGARGYVLKDGEAQELVQAIHRVAAGGVYLSPELGDFDLAEGEG